MHHENIVLLLFEHNNQFQLNTLNSSDDDDYAGGVISTHSTQMFVI